MLGQIGLEQRPGPEENVARVEAVLDEPALASEIARLNVADDVLKSVPLRFN
jgi:hypothetical protein